MDQHNRELLLETARDSIDYGVGHGKPLTVDPSAYDAIMQRFGATFVTLRIIGDLRGCMGTSMPIRALVADVADNAFAAAFRDPRFPPLSRAEVDDLSIQISVLSGLEPIHFRSEEDLLSQLRPGVDGLFLQEGLHRGTFLPAVWDTLPDKRVFLRELKQKAKLDPDYWSDSLSVSRYTTESFA